MAVKMKRFARASFGEKKHVYCPLSCMMITLPTGVPAAAIHNSTRWIWKEGPWEVLQDQDSKDLAYVS